MAQDYLTFAGRAGSSSEIAAWVSLMQGGTSAEQVAYLMLTSIGLNQAHTEDASYVQALYTGVLGRQASGFGGRRRGCRHDRRRGWAGTRWPISSSSAPRR